MLQMLFAIASTGAVLVLSEILCRKRILKGEYARKFVHITCGTFAAMWPLFLSRWQIVALATLFAVAVVVVKSFRLLRSFRAVRRATYGEILYAVGIIASALVFQDGRIYALAVLHMALADGLAAVVGVYAGKKGHIFKFRGNKKSVAGSVTFAVVSFCLNVAFWLTLPVGQQVVGEVTLLFAFLFSMSSALILMCAEIMSPRGSDNVIVPLLAGVLVWMPLAIA